MSVQSPERVDISATQEVEPGLPDNTEAPRWRNALIAVGAATTALAVAASLTFGFKEFVGSDGDAVTVKDTVMKTVTTDPNTDPANPPTTPIPTKNEPWKGRVDPLHGGSPTFPTPDTPITTPTPLTPYTPPR